MSAAITAAGVGKKFRIGASDGHNTLRDSLAAAARRLRNPFAGKRKVDEFWALQDVSFDVRQGEVLGIIGRNGAGKSTLLKLLSRITEPTAGEITVRGRVGSLLEVGTGFHSELTGRENIFLNGAILGMGRTEIVRKFDEIVAFAEVERFLDTPVKHYSSGMYLRLGFAVAAHLEPDILVVDEVLAVGDAEFQKKCLGKMDAVASEGRTVIFVSHNLDAVQRLCSHCLLLDRGQVGAMGPTAETIATYLSRHALGSRPGTDIPLTDMPRNGSGEVRFRRVSFSGGDTGDVAVQTGGRLRIRVELEATTSRAVGALVVTIRGPLGELLIDADAVEIHSTLRVEPLADNCFEFLFAALNLMPGQYSASLWVGETMMSSAYDHLEPAFEFEVVAPTLRSLNSSSWSNAPVFADFTVKTPATSGPPGSSANTRT